MIGTRFPGFEMLPRDAKAGLIIVHGIAEHGARYQPAAQEFAAARIACFVHDQRGHGLSPGPRTHVADFAQFKADLRLIGEDVRRRFPRLPLFVWGHSMGSIVVALAAAHDLNWASGVITTGCALDAMPKLDGAAGAALRLASALLPRLRINLRIDAANLTHDRQEQLRHDSDPLVPRTASLRLLYGFSRACRTSYEHAPQITLPWLAVHGEADRVCPISGSKRLIAALGSRDKQLVSYPGLLHEVHNEDAASRAALFRLMSGWILDRA